MNHLDLSLPSPAENLACDEALLDRAEAGESGGLLRFWESSQVFAVVGYANKVATEVNVTACETASVPVLRRCSGGGTVLQGPGCLNYALVLPITADGPTRNINSANQFIMERNRATIENLLGKPVEIRGHTDLATGGLKFSGNSQRRRKSFLLFHGTFLLNFDLTLITRLLPMPSLEPDYRDGRPHARFVTNLQLPADTVKAALVKAWDAASRGEVPTKEIGVLVAEKYRLPEWNLKF